MKRYIDLVIRFRWVVIAIFLGLTVFFSYFLSKAVISSDPGELIFGDSPQYKRYQELIEEYGGDHIGLFAFQGEDLFSEKNFKKLDRVVKRIEAGASIKRVESLVSVQHIQGSNGVLRIDNYADLVIKNPERKERLLEKITSDPLTRDLFITKDAKNSIVMVELENDVESMENVPQIVSNIARAFEEEGFSPEQLHQGGLIPIMAQIVELSYINLKQFLPATVVILLFMVYLMFRRLWPVILTLFITAMAIMWTMGLAVILFGTLNIFSTIVPAVILIACFADVIHMCSSYFVELDRGETKEVSIFNIGNEVGVACGYTSVTTFFGFMAMAMVPTPIFRQTGFLLGFGVAAALFSALTLVPVFLWIFPKPRPWRTGATSVQGILDRILDLIADFCIKYPRSIVAFFIVLIAFSIYGFTNINFETQLANRFDDSNPVQVSMRYLKKHFPGTGMLDIYISNKSGDDLLDPKLFKKMSEFEEWVESQPQITQVVSIVDLIKKMNKELYPEEAKKAPIPENKEALAQLLLLFEMSGGKQLDKIINTDYSMTRLNGRLLDIGMIETATLANKILDKSNEYFNQKILTETFSLNVLNGLWIDEILDGQKRGLIMAFFTIMFIMIIAMRSLRIGLISMIPNALPLLTLMGYLGIFWDKVDTDTMTVLMIAIGIGVDDTIHFLMRFRFETEKIDNTEKAMRNTFHYSGRAIIITSAILIAGFMPFAWSDYFSVRILGTLLPFTLFIALAADLFLVSAFVQLGWMDFNIERKIARRLLRILSRVLSGK